MKPLRNNVFVKPIEEENDSIIIIPNKDEEFPEKGEVVVVGQEATEVKAGDIVLFRKYAADKFNLEIEGEKQDVLLVPETDILAVIV